MGDRSGIQNQQIIRLVDLEKAYRQSDGGRKVLRGVNAVFAAGEFVAIRGRSGSGKTTLLNLIAGIDLPDRGEIYFGSTSLSGLTADQRTAFRRDHLGFVFQFFNLIPTLTLRENIILPAELAGRSNSTMLNRADALLARVGLEGREDDYPDELSGGEQQRVAIARAVILEPEVLLADEPTGNLDRNTGEDVMQLINQLRTELGTLLILVTHSHRLADRADRVFMLEDGRLDTHVTA
ncbi:MAG: ABC transporter ATP-binding protein [Anaerolineales bacterium]|jgi:putative ABC transport system ATP-binding protein